MAVFNEEPFGPVAAIPRAADADEVIALANQSEYGLGAVLWTSNLDRTRRLSRASSRRGSWGRSRQPWPCP
jgi:succinate-semialdehyde dehydrogenase/glutarate-semialdehyde dehydrogenase